MEDILPIILIFGTGMLGVVVFSPVGRAIADRIRGPRAVTGGTDPEVFNELERMRAELSELQERVDFTERMLAQRREAGQLPGA